LTRIFSKRPKQETSFKSLTFHHSGSDSLYKKSYTLKNNNNYNVTNNRSPNTWHAVLFGDNFSQCV